MTLEPGPFLASLVLGGIGFVLFNYGRKMGRWPHLVAGIALMIYPYFVPLVPMLIIGGALLAVLAVGVRLGL